MADMGNFKGGLISESFSHWLQSPEKYAKKYPKLYPYLKREDAQASFRHIFWEI